MPDDARIAAILAGLLPQGQVATDAMPFPILPGQQYAEGGSVSPKGTVRPLPLIRDAAHLDRLLRNATDDAALQRIKARGIAQGLDVSGWGID
jgi:hypothetical protein